MAITGLVLGPLALVGAIIASIYWTGIFTTAIDCAQRHPHGGQAYERCVNVGGESSSHTSSDDGQQT